MMGTPSLHIVKNDEQWESDVLEFITDAIKSTLKSKSFCSISLSGGSTPKRIYELLAEKGEAKGVNWNKVQLFWGDERSVLHTHPDSNYNMVKEALLDHVDIPGEQIFPVPHPDDPETAAAEYDQIIAEQFPDGGPTFDLCLLGMGGDGHTASIFPYTSLVHETEARVKEVYVKSQDAFRISMTAPVLNRAHKIAFLIKGVDKAQALKQVLEGNHNPDEYPSQLIRRNSDVFFFLDEDAASELDGTR